MPLVSSSDRGSKSSFHRNGWLHPSLLFILITARQTSSFNPHNSHECLSTSFEATFRRGYRWSLASDWSGFGILDDDDETAVDNQEYAREEDSFEKKAKLGSLILPPTIEIDADPILVPIGRCNDSTLEMTDHPIKSNRTPNGLDGHFLYLTWNP